MAPAKHEQRAPSLPYREDVRMIWPPGPPDASADAPPREPPEDDAAASSSPAPSVAAAPAATEARSPGDEVSSAAVTATRRLPALTPFQRTAEEVFSIVPAAAPVPARRPWPRLPPFPWVQTFLTGTVLLMGTCWLVSWFFPVTEETAALASPVILSLLHIAAGAKLPLTVLVAAILVFVKIVLPFFPELADRLFR